MSRPDGDGGRDLPWADLGKGLEWIHTPAMPAAPAAGADLRVDDLARWLFENDPRAAQGVTWDDVRDDPWHGQTFSVLARGLLAGPLRSLVEEAAEAEQRGYERGRRDFQFAPEGDNHHNAALCPYCSAALVEQAAEAARLREIFARVLWLQAAEAARLRDTVARAEALAEKWSAAGYNISDAAISYWVAADDLRRALDGEGTGTGNDEKKEHGR